jgi:D-xylose 1-dehydrogenase (NADP+, D-xylono-1,5-lactone-forming)
MPEPARVRWGILATGSINQRFLLHAREAANAEFVAVGSRSPERAKAFAGEYGIERAHGTYEELLADPGVDAVYNCTPNSLHHEWTMRALRAGKHVLCEKPYSRRSAEVEEAFDFASSAGLSLMEGFMWRHTPQIRRFIEVLPDLGPLQAIRATFSFRIAGDTDVRLAADLDGGSLMDVGCYCLSGIRVVAGAEPERVHGEQVVGDSGVDVSFSGLLRFADGLTATFTSGFRSEHASLEAIGSKGSLLLPSAWNGRATAMFLDGREIPLEQDDPYRLEVENLSAAIRGEAEPLLGRADALGQARAIEALYRSADTGHEVALSD